jgi:hypothetical protein
MRTLKSRFRGSKGSQVIARFGHAMLVREEGRRYALVGGNDSDALEAREWAAHFLHEAVLPPHRPACRG